MGRVIDETGGVIPGASVIAVNVGTNVSTQTVTNDEGNYRIPFLLPGEYRVTVELTGFRKVERTGVRMSVGSDTTVDITMPVGEISQSITVAGSAPLVNNTNADLGQVIEKTLVDHVPLSLTRNVMNRVMLSAAVTGNTGTYTANSQSEISISGGGSDRGGNEIMVDGIPNTVPQSGGITLFVPSIDLVQEMKVHTTMFDASLGHSSGGAINFTTRGGTNQYHGSAYYYGRFKPLNANSWSNNRLGLEQGPVGYDQWGGVFGGPVDIPWLYKGKDRTFFLVSYEADTEGRDYLFEGRVPTELERKGDFSQTLNRLGTGILEIYDPWTTTGSGSSAKRTAFPNSIIPSSRITKTGSVVANMYPLPNQDVLPQIGRYNWAAVGIVGVDQSQFSARVDQVISDRQKMFARFSRLTREAASPVLFDGAYSTPEGENLGTEWRTFDSVAVDDTYTFSPTLVGSFRYGFAQRSSPRRIPATLLDPAPLELSSQILQNQATIGFPRFQLGEGFAEFGSSDRQERSYISAGLATFYKIQGKHSIKWGVDYRNVRKNTNNPGTSASGSFTYNNTFTRSNPFVSKTADTSGTSLASLLLGIPASGSLGFSSPRSIQNHYFAWFIQEDWKIRPNLTLNFGLRHELETPYTERFNRIAHGFDFDAPSPITVPGMDLKGGVLFAGVDGNPRTAGNLDGNNSGPRFGFAYSYNDKTVIRGGYGLFYSAHTYQTSFDGNIATFNANTSYVGTTDSGGTPFTTLANPFPNGMREVQGALLGLAARYGDSLTFFDPNFVNPYNQQWQLSVQRQLPFDTVLEVAYAGMLSLKQLESFNLNEKPDQYLALKAEESKAVPNPFLGIFDPTSSLGQGKTKPQSQFWKLYPQYGTLTMEGANTGRAVYHAMQSKVEKRFSQGFSLLVSHAWSKLIDNNTTSWVNTRHYRSVSGQDRRQLLKISSVYELPFGPGRTYFSASKGFLARLLEGWMVSAYFNASSGAPLQIEQDLGRPVVLRNPTKSGSVSGRLGLEQDPETGRPLNPYFDIDAFAPLEDQWTISPTEPYLDWLRGPGSWNLNLSALKNMSITEDVKFQLRVDATNATNSPHWGDPGTDMSNASTFGVIRSGGGGRSMQVGARLTF
ncbi:MAG: carboxypeptidase regulatory-like domain-containing protein [Acidobacteriota bacterium]